MNLIKRFIQWYKRRVIRFGKKIAAFQIRVMFTIAYFIFIVPFGFILKIFPGSPRVGWHKVKSEKVSLDDARRQF